MRFLVPLVVLLAGLAGCGSDDTSVPTDPGSDASIPSGLPTKSSATADATPDPSASTQPTTPDPTTPAVTVRASDVEQQIDQQLQRRTGIDGTIECGLPRTWKAPSVHACYVTGEEVQAEVRVTLDVAGEISWRLR